MESMNISLPETLREFVLKQAESGYGSASEYIRELIRADQARKDQDELETKLLEGLASGKGTEFSKADWKAMRESIVARLSSRSSST